MLTFLPIFPSPKKRARLGSVDLFICSPIPALSGISLRFQKEQDGFMFLTALRLLERVQTDHPRRSTGLLESVNCIKTKSTQSFSSCHFSFHNQEALNQTFRTVIHSTRTDYLPRNKAWVWTPWPWSLWCWSHCWETGTGGERGLSGALLTWFSLPGIVPPHAQRAVFWPPLEQNVQQWNTPGCERCLFLTVTVNGEPFSVQTKSKEQPHESTGVC